jgi:hypothetical protein
MEDYAEQCQYCVYCENYVLVIDQDTRFSEPCDIVPEVDDDEAWEERSLWHLPGCEWIETRAHRLPG